MANGGGETLKSVLLALAHWLYIRHRVFGAWLTIALVPLGAVMIAAAGSRSTTFQEWLFWVGSAVTTAGVLGAILNEWAKSAFIEEGDKDAQRVWILMRDALHPVLARLGTMPQRSQGGRDSDLSQAATSAAHGLWLVLAHVPGTRVVVYRLDRDRSAMHAIASIGRGDSSNGFEPDTARGQKAVAMVRRGDSLLMLDVADSDPELYDGSRSGYRSFFSCSIHSGAGSSITPFGMLTVDAPEANSFTHSDARVIQLVADLLAVAFAIAEEAPRRHK